jgi:D-glycero-D-manno-heptose 1,7-bisphosphate phosphatase
VARHTWSAGEWRGTVALVAPSGRRALFLDFGGTLVLTREHRTVVDPAGDPVVLPGVVEALARCRPAFDACCIVSNQARIGLGEISEAEVRRRFTRLNERLGGPFTDWRLCPHTDADGCACRKPRPGMFLDLARARGFDLARSTHVGDSWKDEAAAGAAGIGCFVWAAQFFGGSDRPAAAAAPD